METFYYDLSPETISLSENAIKWFKENNKKLIDYLFEETVANNLTENSGNGNIKTQIQYYYTFKIENPLPMEVQDKLVKLWVNKRIHR